MRRAPHVSAPSAEGRWGTGALTPPPGGVEMLSVRRLLAVTLAWSLVKGLDVATEVRNGWLLASSDRDVRV